MNETPDRPPEPATEGALNAPPVSAPPPALPGGPPVPEVPMPAVVISPRRALPWWPALAALALLVACAAVAVAWSGTQRVQMLEQELVRRQQDSSTQAAQARLLADQSQALARDAVAKATLLETRVAEVALQRGQLEELMRSLSRSRDENVVADIDAGIRVAIQQAAITGSAAPLVAALKAADERLARVAEPRLEAARRALARDLDRVKAASVADVATLSIKIDEAVRLVDEMPLLVVDRVSAATTESRASREADPKVAKPGPASAAASAASAASPAASGSGWDTWLPTTVRNTAGAAWDRMASEVRSLLRVTRIDQPQAMLLAPEQSYFLRENLKLRLLNARLALLSRQFDTAQSDVQAALAAIDANFDRNARKTQLATELLRGVSQQARQSGVPRPDDTLSVLAAAAAGR